MQHPHAPAAGPEQATEHAAQKLRRHREQRGIGAFGRGLDVGAWRAIAGSSAMPGR